MTANEFAENVESIPYGKGLPTAKYIYWASGTDLPGSLSNLLNSLHDKLSLGSDFNVVKFSLKDFAVSFLSYPDFWENPHPVLCESAKVNLATGTIQRISFSGRSNPPILHRKEAFLPPGHSLVPEFSVLTKTEEEAGLYDSVATIGFEENWRRLLEQKGLAYRGHELVSIKEVTSSEQVACKSTVRIARHRTALVRDDLSKPIKLLLKHDLLRTGRSLFDYGCGYGTDVQGLKELGYDACGWDPVLRPSESLIEADVVNLGFVLNVIEDPAERVEALGRAWSLARELLIVSTLIQSEDNHEHLRAFGDGVLTKRRTFQKYFDQNELAGLIEATLDHDPVPIGLGVFLVFRDPVRKQDFLCQRRARAIDWENLSMRLGVLRSIRPRASKAEMYEANKELLESFWARMLELGRTPRPEEFDRYVELKEKVRSSRNATDIFFEKYGVETFEAARRQRREDLLVYLASCQFEKKVTWNHFSPMLQRDIKAFFGDYQSGAAETREMLFAAGDPDEIELACEALRFGWQDEQALYFHRSLVCRLPILLRIFVECATRLYGDPAEADILKIHKRSKKLTLLHYENFERSALPRLVMRIKVSLRDRFVNVFDYSDSQDPQLLPFKERFLSSDHPDRDKMDRISLKLRRLGLAPETCGHGPTLNQLKALIDSSGYTGKPGWKLGT
jgi:DNA phosphorothioation-associated putative methyltransferase